MSSHGADIAMGEVYPSTENEMTQEQTSSMRSSEPKHVSFELFLPEAPQHRARLPMRVNIYPHDTTDSIITTVKNFYGLYERRGVIFQDHRGTTLIARYENFTHNMVVYVRVADEDPEIEHFSPGVRESTSPRRPRLDEPFQMLPPSVHHHHVPSRPDSRTASRLSVSPQPGRGRRSASASTSIKPRTRPAPKSRGTSSHGSFADPNADAYSDSDGGDASVTSSRRGRKEQVASAEISLDNIVEGGRRKRAKFDSSELPLFVPPQVPMTASLSSISPQRRVSSQNGASPYYSNQQTFAYPQPLASPQSYGQGDNSWANGLITPYSNSSSQAQGYRSRTRGSAQYVPYRQTGSTGLILPTPDPTIGSVISDEDVARQLMRLGDASNFSSHGRTSTSTLDDALSGKAEAASSSDESDEGSDDDEQELPPLPYAAGRAMRLNGDSAQVFDSGETSGEEYEDNRDDSFKGESDDIVPDEHHSHGMQPLTTKARSSVSNKTGKPVKARSSSKGKGKPTGLVKQPMSPSSMPSQSRKASSASLNFQHQLGVDEEDLSSKPRCQRCRKSKKGCDRQRPCQRCKDAGIGVDGCISEDEGNGRKGRYGRHMGVPVKKTQMEPPPTPDQSVSAGPTSYIAMSAGAVDKSKKRKRPA